MQESEDRTCSLRQGGERGEKGGQSEESATTGLHCTQQNVQTSSQENGTGEDFNPAMVALQVNAETKSAQVFSGNRLSEAGPHNQRPPGSMTDFQVRVSSFRIVTLTKSNSSK